MGYVGFSRVLWIGVGHRVRIRLGGAFGSTPEASARIRCPQGRNH